LAGFWPVCSRRGGFSSGLGYPATEAVFNPSDWSKVALSKASGTGEYLFPGLPAAGPSASLLGLRAVVSPNLAADRPSPRRYARADVEAEDQHEDREPETVA
jgi:hypothetical protein